MSLVLSNGRSLRLTTRRVLLILSSPQLSPRHLLLFQTRRLQTWDMPVSTSKERIHSAREQSLFTVPSRKRNCQNLIFEGQWRISIFGRGGRDTALRIFIYYLTSHIEC